MLRRPTLIVTTLLATAVSGILAAAPAQAANPVTPGTFTGYGFDQCEAPSQAAMTAWRAHSPFRAAGIYISGNSRACRTQSNLNTTWVRNQLAAGWHLLPITLGPQASCSTRYPRYGWSIDPKINPSTTNDFATARAQGAAEARKTVGVAKTLGLVPGSTMFYDIEAWNIHSSTACNYSALYFLSAWTTQLHALGYASGIYSSAASGMKLIDDQRVRTGSRVVLPDQVWIADWNGHASTASSYIRSDGWQPSSRVHQYQGGHRETWGGVSINIDRNYLSLTTPRLTGVGTTPSPSTSDPHCTAAAISKTLYRRTGAHRRAWLHQPLQCLLKQQHRYGRAVTGSWSRTTLSAMRNYQKSVGHRVRYSFVRSDWVTLLSAGNSGATLRQGTTGADVIRLQRALNAALSMKLRPNGIFDARTASAVAAYQKAVGITPTRVVASLTWSALRHGRW